jgi:hypothetical protein
VNGTLENCGRILKGGLSHAGLFRVARRDQNLRK